MSKFEVQVYKGFEIIVLFPKTEHSEHSVHTSRLHCKVYLNVIGGGSEHRRSGSCPQEPYLVGDMKRVWELLGCQPENSKGSESEKGIIMHHRHAGRSHLHLEREGFPGGGSLFAWNLMFG